MRTQQAACTGRSGGRAFAACMTPPRARILTRVAATASHVTGHEAQERRPASSGLSAASRYAMSGMALAMVGSLVAEPALAADIAAHAASATTLPMEQFQLAENQEFFSNVVRYGRYFVTVMLGTGYVMLRPLTSAFKSPVSAVLAVAGVVGSVLLVKLTLEAMLGMGNESLPFDYIQGNF